MINFFLFIFIFIGAVFLISLVSYLFWSWFSQTHKNVSHNHSVLPFFFIDKVSLTWFRNKAQVIIFEKLLPFSADKNVSYSLFLTWFTKVDQEKITNFFQKNIQTKTKSNYLQRKIIVSLEKKIDNRLVNCFLQVVEKDQQQKRLIVVLSNFIKTN